MSEIFVHINGRFLSQPLTGVQRHAMETVSAMDRLLQAQSAQLRLSCELLLPPDAAWNQRPLSCISVRQVGRLRGHAWEQLVLPLRAPGLLLNLCNSFPLLARRPIVTVHDASVLAAPEGYTRAFVLFYRLLFAALRLRRAIPVLTDSEFSAGELRQRAGIERERIRVVHCGTDHWSGLVPDDSVLERLGLRGRRYVLAVASENPNKNLWRLVEAFARIDDPESRLVLVGGRNDSVFAASTAIDSRRVIRTGRVDDRELAALYRAAACFAFPSLYEGFGLPPLEAMRYGCPVVVSREASLPEVCGEAARYCDARDPASIADALRAVLEDPVLDASLRELGPQQAARYNWDDTARAVLEAIGARR